MNLPYDATKREIEQLVKEFADIDDIAIPRDKIGRTRGYAFVYLKKAEDASKLIEYVDGRHIRNRQIRVKKQLGKEDGSVDESQQTPSEENIDSMMEFSKFYKRFILSKVYDPKFIGLKDG